MTTPGHAPRPGRRPSTLVLLAVLLLGGAGAGCGPAEPEAAPSTSTGPRPTATTADRCPAAETGTTGDGTLAVGGVERPYRLTLPAIDDGRTPRPLVVALHGHGGSAAELEARTQLAERGAARGAVVVMPDALGTPARWNFDRRPDGPDDFAFVDALVAELSERHCVDPDRTFVVGSSNGAAFAGLLACTEPYRFAAVAMVIATVPSVCPDGVTPPVLTIRGTADAHVPFEGAPELVAGVADHAGCRGSPTTEHPTERVERTRYTGCRDGAEVVLDAVVGGTHTWPGGVEPTGAHAREADGYDATDEVLTFFEHHGRSR